MSRQLTGMYGWPWRMKLAAIVTPGDPDECWRADPTKCSIDKDGYAHITATDTDEHLVHRLAVLADGREIPEGYEVDHVAEVCQHRDCANPTHLEVVLKRENVRRAWAGYVPKLVCTRGHSKSDAYPDGSCRICKAEDSRAKVAAAGFRGRARDQRKRQRQQEVARLVAAGWKNRQIAVHLGVDRSTVSLDRAALGVRA